jgi:hypothetical protein
MLNNKSLIIFASICISAIALYAWKGSFSASNVSVTPSFYYFKTTGSYKDFEPQLSKEFPKHRIYQKILDITGNFYPAAINNIEAGVQGDVEVVPTVYIQNDCFSYVDSQAVSLNATRIVRGLKGKPTELQIDCDWTSSTKDLYFYFLQMIKKAAPQLTLSATIRLYPFKYQTIMGVPPVDRGMLMLYNVSRINDIATQNSILDINEAQKYMTVSYPLPLDVALPVFAQSEVFRDGKMIALLRAFDPAMAVQQSYLKKNADNRFTFQQDTLVQGQFFRIGDQLRAEDISNETLKAAVDLASKAVKSNSKINVALYHLDESVLKRYSMNDFKTIFNRF